MNKNFFDNKVNELKGNSNKVIRFESFKVLSIRYKNKINPIELISIANKLYKELEDEYGITVPADFLVGKDNKGDGVIYSIVDKINGKSLIDKNIEISDEFTEQTQKLYESIAKYFFNKLKQGGFYLTDINGGSQYVFGKKNGVQNNKIYLIDTDIYLNNSKIAIYTVVEWLTRHVLELENKFNVKFEKSREYIDKFVNEKLPEEISESEKDKIIKNILGIKNFLDGKKLGIGPSPAIPPFD